MSYTFCLGIIASIDLTFPGITPHHLSCRIPLRSLVKLSVEEVDDRQLDQLTPEQWPGGSGQKRKHFTRTTGIVLTFISRFISMREGTHVAHSDRLVCEEG